MRKLLPVAVVAILMISCSKEKEEPNEVNPTDKAFIVQTYLAGKAEIRAGQLAIDKGSSITVKNFAHQIVADYQLMQSDLIAVANKLNFALTDTATLSAQNISGLAESSGFAFDTAYLGSRARSHLSILSVFQQELNEGNNPYVRYYFLNKYIDKIRGYFREADSLSRAL
jgi:putative membrane protein